MQVQIQYIVVCLFFPFINILIMAMLLFMCYTLHMGNVEKYVNL